jgi:hypothetical protein
LSALIAMDIRQLDGNAQGAKFDADAHYLNHSFKLTKAANMAAGVQFRVTCRCHLLTSRHTNQP